MALKDHAVPQKKDYVKLSSYPDGENIKVYGVGIISGGKYGDQPYFVLDDGACLTLPTRYTQYVQDIMDDEEAVKELQAGVDIMKESYDLPNGTTTPIFSFVNQ